MPNTSNDRRPNRVRSALMAGTAALALLGGAAGATLVAPPPQVAHAEEIQAPAVAAPVDFADLVEAVSPAVVSVRVEGAGAAMRMSRDGMPGMPDFRGMPEFRDLPEDHPLHRFFREFGERDERSERKSPRTGPQRVAQGSGFIISEDGYIVTNNHVVSGGTGITVVLNDGRELEAEIVGTDDKTDLAVLKVASDEALPYVPFTAGDVRVGEWVVAVGNPFGLGGSVTAGIVSARGRDIGSGPYDDYLQIDAPVNRGNSGGPAFNLRGEVIGVNTAIFSPSGGNVGIAFAIPAAEAQPVVQELIENGSVSRGWLGVQIQPVTEDIAESLGLDAASGALVADTLDTGPAGEAGVKVGDVILSVDGEAVEDARDLVRRIGRLDPGVETSLELWRDGEVETVGLTLGQQPGAEEVAAATIDADDDASAMLGLALAPATPGGGAGVAIVDVDPEGEAARKGLQAGDVIVAAGGKTVASPSDVQAAVEAAKERGREAVLLRVQSGEAERFVALSLRKA